MRRTSACDSSGPHENSPLVGISNSTFVRIWGKVPFGACSRGGGDIKPPQPEARQTTTTSLCAGKKIIDTIQQCISLHQGFSNVDAADTRLDRSKCLCPCSKALELCWADKYHVYYKFKGCKDKTFTSRLRLPFLGSLFLRPEERNSLPILLMPQ